MAACGRDGREASTFSSCGIRLKLLYPPPGRAGPESILVTLLKSWFVSSGGTPPSFFRHSRRVLQVTGRSSDRRIRGPSRSCIGTSVRPSAFLLPVPFDRESHIRRCSSWPALRRAVALAIDLSYWIVCRPAGRERRLIVVTFSLLSLYDPPLPTPHPCVHTIISFIFSPQIRDVTAAEMKESFTEGATQVRGRRARRRTERFKR